MVFLHGKYRTSEGFSPFSLVSFYKEKILRHIERLNIARRKRDKICRIFKKAAIHVEISKTGAFLLTLFL